MRVLNFDKDFRFFHLFLFFNLIRFDLIFIFIYFLFLFYFLITLFLYLPLVLVFGNFHIRT